MDGDLQSKTAENEELMRNLAREGVQLDMASMLKMRLDFVTEFLVPADRLVEFGLAWETKVNEALTEATAQINRAKLLGGHEQLTIASAL